MDALTVARRILGIGLPSLMRDRFLNPRGRAGHIQITASKTGELLQAIDVVHPHTAVAYGKEAQLPQLAQHAVHMDGGHPQGVGENELRERASELCLRRDPNQTQPFRQFQEEVRRAFDGATSSYADEALDNHGVVPGSSPEKRRPEAGEVCNALYDVSGVHGCDHRICQRRERMIRSSQQRAAYPYTVARDRKRNDLTLAIGQIPIPTSPARMQNKGFLPYLPLLGEQPAALYSSWIGLNVREALLLHGSERKKLLELLR
jgi:hypothetical protein